MTFKKKELTQINNETGNLIREFSIKGKYRLIGSNSLRAVSYGSDYDAESHLKGATPQTIAHRFQREVADAVADPNVWITDFKVGYDPRLVYRGDYSRDSILKYVANPLIPESRRKAILETTGEDQRELVRDLFILRWTPDEIEAGKKRLIDGTYRSLVDAVQDKTILKIDLITLVGNQFLEISINYYIRFANGETNQEKQPSQKEMKTALEDDIHYYSKRDSFKALKRLFSLLMLEGESKHKAKIGKLLEFFNGQVGYLNKIKNELTILEMVLTSKFRKPKWEDVVANLQFIKEQISQVYEIPLTDKIFKTINETTPKKVLGDVITLRDYFAGKINEDSKAFLREIY
jgi:uncharacterized protein YkvS